MLVTVVLLILALNNLGNINIT